MGRDDTPILFQRAIIRQLAGMRNPSAQHHGQRTISCQPFAVVFARQLDVRAG